jgi:ATP-binding cassette, subfamily C (CFTR/MRP), member 10
MCGPDGLHPWDPKTRDMGYCFQRLFLLIPALFLIAATSAYFVGRQVNWVVRGKLQERAIVLRSATVLCLALLPIMKLYIFLQGDGKAYGIDYFTCGTEFIAWIVHLAFLMALRQRLGVSPRGPIFLLVLWSISAMLSIIGLRTLILMERKYGFAIVTLVFQVIYAITLLPSEGVTSPKYNPAASVGSQYSQVRISS